MELVGASRDSTGCGAMEEGLSSSVHGIFQTKVLELGAIKAQRQGKTQADTLTGMGH